MGAETKIEWCQHTFNIVWGCSKVSPACKNCYAEAWAKRTGHKVWGVDAPRRTFGEKHWREPLAWARGAAKAGERRRVFCSSMADVFEDHPALEPERKKLWNLIRDTAVMGGDHLYPRPPKAGEPGLDWLLLTKRPENVLRMAPADILPLVWVGTTVEDQGNAEKRIPELLKVPARVRFLSCEPLLEEVDLREPLGVMWHATLPFNAATGELMPVRSAGWQQSYNIYSGAPIAPKVDWVIVGGESGPGARPFELAWARIIRDQCAAAGVAFFCKQLGAVAFEDGAGQHCQFELELKDPKGGNPDEWPPDLRVRQFPEVRP